jgi:hypothetical protein
MWILHAYLGTPYALLIMFSITCQKNLSRAKTNKKNNMMRKK